MYIQAAVRLPKSSAFSLSAGVDLAALRGVDQAAPRLGAGRAGPAGGRAGAGAGRGRSRCRQQPRAGGGAWARAGGAAEVSEGRGAPGGGHPVGAGAISMALLPCSPCWRLLGVGVTQRLLHGSVMPGLAVLTARRGGCAP